ncbi:MAG: hypothetical protein IM516_11650 [Pseudanabaena sp. M158S2SP1A06QC]|nr:hypothetical protein [Pseudanabaena sp. M158S2SP1A06QC]
MNYGNRKQHDFALFKASRLHFHAQTQGFVDKGYQGLQKLHPNSLIPIKKIQNGSLSKVNKWFNRHLASQRIAIDHVNCRLKIFKILS